MNDPTDPAAPAYRSATRPPRRPAVSAPVAPAAAPKALRALDGRELWLRPIRPGDAKALRRAFLRLTPEQVRARFFYRMTEFGDALAERLCRPDPAHSVAFVAVDADGEIRGEARIHVDAAAHGAEFAIAVDHDFLGKGVGRALMGELVEEGRRRGLAELWGDVLADNHTMLDFVRHLDLAAKIEHGDEPGVLRVHLRIPPAGPG